jgi:ribosome-associated protein
MRMAFTIPEVELEFRVSRSSGPGGQHVNTTSTRVEVRWNVRHSTALSDADRTWLLERLAHRLDRHGCVRVVSSARRSQQQNRTAAIDRLQALVTDALRRPKHRRKTKPSRAVREARLKEKRARAERKERRRRVDPDGER